MTLWRNVRWRAWRCGCGCGMPLFTDYAIGVGDGHRDAIGFAWIEAM